MILERESRGRPSEALDPSLAPPALSPRASPPQPFDEPVSPLARLPVPDACGEQAEPGLKFPTGCGPGRVAPAQLRK